MFNRLKNGVRISSIGEGITVQMNYAERMNQYKKPIEYNKKTNFETIYKKAVIAALSVILAFLSSGTTLNAKEMKEIEKQRISASSLASSSIGPSNENIEIAVSSNGNYTIGIPGGAILLYGHPSPGTSGTTIKVDETDYWNAGSSTWGTVITSPYVEGDSSITKWTVANSIELTQTLTIVPNSYTGESDTIKIEYLVKNEDTNSHDVGIRIMLDTMLANNDGAPFKILGSDVTTETEYLSGNIPGYWQAFDSLTAPTVTSQGSLIGGESTVPDRFVIAYWWNIKNTRWDFSITSGRSVTSDSAVGIYWNPSVLSPGETRRYVTYYGIGGVGVDTTSPLSVGISAPAEVSRENEELSPNPFTITAYIENSASGITGTVTNIQAQLILPVELTLSGTNPQTVNVGNLARGAGTQVVWEVMPVEDDETDTFVSGTLSYSIKITANQGEKTLQKTIYIPHWLRVSIDMDQDAWNLIPGRSVTFTAIPQGQLSGETINYSWDLDEDAEWDDGTSNQATQTYYLPSRHLIGVKIENASTEAVAKTWIYVTIIPSPVTSEPIVTPAVDMIAGNVVNENGASFVFDPAKKDVGCIIITHGLHGTASNKWLKTLAQEIETRIRTDRGEAFIPNISFYDWEEMADPERFLFEDTGADTILDALTLIRPYGLAEGLILADWIETRADAGDIDLTKPIHIIGHSAGGFVAGNCASILTNEIKQVTLLDTPAPNWNIYWKYLPAGGKVDAYITLYGTFPTPWEDRYPSQTYTKIVPIVSSYSLTAEEEEDLKSYLDEDIPSNEEASDEFKGTTVFGVEISGNHSWAYAWYGLLTTTKKTSVGSNNLTDGFYYSPWLGHSLPSSAQKESNKTMPTSMRIAMATINEFQTFGTVNEASGTYTITEGGGNAGIFKTVDLPADVTNVSFRYKFTTAGDGDFLSVHIKDESGTDKLLYIGPDLSLSRENYVDGEALVSDYAGQTTQLIFKLNSRSSTNAVLSIDSITLATSDTTAPSSPTGVTATAGDSQVTLRWSNPTDTDFAGVKVIRKTGGYPASVTDGTEIYSGTGTSATDTGLTNGTACYYTVFAYDEVPNYSTGAQATATPQAAGGGSGGGGGGGCFIATAAYGTPIAGEVRTLCDFRDAHLLTNPVGRRLVAFYYKVSPPIADFIAKHESLKSMVRFFLKPVIRLVE